MANLTTRQIAELLVGVARAQQAMIDAIESQKAGYKQSHLSSALTNAARIRNTAHVPTLMDFPSRVLLAFQGRNPPDVAQLERDLDSLLGGHGAAAPAADAPSLDMTS